MTIAPNQQRYLPAGLPAPAVIDDALDSAFWAGTRDHRLMVQTCAQCGSAQWPPEEICSACHSFERTWVQASGHGKVFSWTRIWHPVHPALRDHGPYIVVIVELYDYPVRIAGNLLGDPHQAVQAGIPVRAAFEDGPDGKYALVQWLPTPNADAGTEVVRG